MPDVHPATPLGSPAMPVARVTGPAPELTAAMLETRVVRDSMALMLAKFRPAGDGTWFARTGYRAFRSWHQQAGLPVPSETGYGPDADELHAEVHADNAKDAKIKRLHAELAEFRASRDDDIRAAWFRGHESATKTEADTVALIQDRDRLQGELTALRPQVAENDRLARELHEARRENAEIRECAHNPGDVRLLDRWRDVLHRIANGAIPAGGAAQEACDALDGATPGPDTLAHVAAQRNRYGHALDEAREVLQRIALGTAGPPHVASVTADKAAGKIREALEQP